MTATRVIAVGERSGAAVPSSWSNMLTCDAVANGTPGDCATELARVAGECCCGLLLEKVTKAQGALWC